jgi:precorrin-2/cobalt-factor-2 C20-methyltransferase
MNIGTLYGIGAGPGDPELMTWKGVKTLQSVPVVAFPAGIQGRLGVAERIIQPWLLPHQIQLPLDFPYVREEDVLVKAWRIAAAKVWEYLRQGQDVAFVSEGDVSFYSTFTYLWQHLLEINPQATMTTIPGICSPLAAAAELGIPLTIQGEKLVILPAIYHVNEFESALDYGDVIVLMKVSSVYQQIWQILERRGLLQHSWAIAKATLPDRVIYADLRDRPDLKLPYFSLLIVKVNAKPNSHPIT